MRIVTLSVLWRYAGPMLQHVHATGLGTGSKLSLPALATMTADATQFQLLDSSPGIVGQRQWEAAGASAISGGPVQLESDGTNSKLNVSALTSFSENIGSERFFSGLQVTNHATLLDGVLATMNEANLTLDGTGTESLGQITTVTTGTLTVSGGTVVLAGLSHADASSFQVSGGGSLTLPVLTSYTGILGTLDTWQATGAGSVLSLPTLTTITEDTTNGNSWTQVQALAGGSVQLPLLTRVGNGPVLLESDGAGSQLNVSALPSFQGLLFDGHESMLQVTNHAAC